MGIRVISLPEWSAEPTPDEVDLNDLFPPPEEAPTEPPSPPAREVTADRLTAVLRWRARRLLRTLASREANAVRLLPGLLQWKLASELRHSAVDGRRFRIGRRTLRLADQLGLRPVRTDGVSDAAVEAVLIVPDGPSLRVLLTLSSAVQPEQLRRVEARVIAVQRVLDNTGARVRVVLLRPTTEGLASLLDRCMAFGGLLGGSLTYDFWADRQTSLAELLPHAPTPLARLCLAFVGEPHLAASAAVRVGLEDNTAQALSDGELLCGVWAAYATSTRPELRDVLLRTVGIAAADSQTRTWAQQQLGWGGWASTNTSETLLGLGRTLAVQSSRAIRLAVRALPASKVLLRAWWWNEVGSLGIPIALLPSLSDVLRAPLLLDPAFTAHGAAVFEVRDATGALVTRGHSAMQVRLRALVIWARTRGASSPFPDADPVSQQLLPLLIQPPDRTRAFLVVDAQDESGAPLDLLNRGPERRTTLSGAMVVRVAPDRPLTAYPIDPAEAPLFVAQFTMARHALEIIASRPTAGPVARRLQQIRTLAEEHRTGFPLAIESAGKVYLFGARLRCWPMDGWAHRPRQIEPDPAAPDLSVSPDSGLSGLGFSGNGIGCYCSLGHGELITVLLRDRFNWFLREVIALPQLLEYLIQTEQALAAAPVPSVLSIRMSTSVVQALNRRPAPAEPCTEISIGGSLPTGLRVRVNGEWFGSMPGTSWRAAAEAILSGWPVDTPGRMSFRDISVAQGDRALSGILMLYARSAVRRRLETHMKQSTKRRFY